MVSHPVAIACGGHVLEGTDSGYGQQPQGGITQKVIDDRRQRLPFRKRGWVAFRVVTVPPHDVRKEFRRTACACSAEQDRRIGIVQLLGCVGKATHDQEVGRARLGEQPLQLVRDVLILSREEPPVFCAEGCSKLKMKDGQIDHVNRVDHPSGWRGNEKLTARVGRFSGRGGIFAKR